MIYLVLLDAFIVDVNGVELQYQYTVEVVQLEYLVVMCQRTSDD